MSQPVNPEYEKERERILREQAAEWERQRDEKCKAEEENREAAEKEANEGKES